MELVLNITAAVLFSLACGAQVIWILSCTAKRLIKSQEKGSRYARSGRETKTLTTHSARRSNMTPEQRLHFTQVLEMFCKDHNLPTDYFAKVSKESPEDEDCELWQHLFVLEKRYDIKHENLVEYYGPIHVTT